MIKLISSFLSLRNAFPAFCVDCFNGFSESTENAAAVECLIGHYCCEVQHELFVARLCFPADHYKSLELLDKGY